MESEGLRQRSSTTDNKPSTAEKAAADEHPGGPPKHPTTQAIKITLLALYFTAACCSLHVTQWIGAPLYFYDKDWYYSWMAMTKQHFGLLLVTMQQAWSPTKVRVSGDKSMRGQFHETTDGRLECDFPERIVLIANHMIYTDWLYLWFMAYASRMHGYIYIILKEQLKYIPLLGPGMMFFSFVFLSRHWASDKPRFQHRLKKLKSKHRGLVPGTKELNPMWMLIFPEGTNISQNGREKSRAWAEKSGKVDLKHALLPRSTGLHFCLEELQDTVDWVYDCTLAYEGVPPGEYAQDIFTLKSIYLQGRAPKSVSMHWRRFAVKDIPMEAKTFDEWLEARWREKDDILDYYERNGRFPADEDATIEHVPIHNGAGIKKPTKPTMYVKTTVKPRSPTEFLQIFAPFATLILIVQLVRRMWNWLLVSLALRSK